MEPTFFDPASENRSGRKFAQIISRLKEPKVYGSLFVIVLVIAVFTSIAYRYTVASKKNGSADQPVKKAGLSLFNPITSKIDRKKRYTSSLDGVQYDDEAAANRHALGVIIENHTDARPQSGLADAAVVYEAIAEGGITRFLAIFGPKYPSRVGPIRSARTYYLDWCLEYDCFFAHVGGNIDALDLIPKIGIKDLDQFRYGTGAYGKTYYRVPRTNIATEHTMFGDPSKLYGLAKNNGWDQTGGHPNVSFKDDIEKSARPTSQIVNIEISNPQFNTSWSYDPVINSYARTMGGLAHKDGTTGNQIKSKTLIVQEMNSRATTTRINELGFIMDTVGSGKAKIFSDGKRIDGSWKKTSQTARTIFSDENGDEIRYNPGQRWITVVSPDTAVVTTQPTPQAQ